MTRLEPYLIAACLAAAMTCGGCKPLPTRPPENLVELRRAKGREGKAFTHDAIALHNLRRVLKEDLAAPARVESLRVIEAVDAPESEICPALAQVMARPKTPPKLHQAVVAFLAKRRYVGLAPSMVPALKGAADPTQRKSILKWILEHPSPEVLVEVVKLWAAEKSTTAEMELTYRQIVERSAKKKWDQALLEGLNQKEFFARGSAIEILVSRIPAKTLQRRIAALKPQTVAVLTMQGFARGFGHLPKTRRELLAAVTLYRRRHRYMTPASRLASKWRVTYRYRFNIRDFHLLSALAADPLRDTGMSRAKLAAAVSRAIARRRAVSAEGIRVFRRSRKTVFRRGRLVDFDGQVESLSMGDLWNLFLLNEMLSRPRVARMLDVTAQRDRADRATQWGGLIFYESGQCEAKLYWPAAKRGDDSYVPSGRMMLDATDSMGFFIGHFSRASQDPAWAGPTDKELALAKAHNLCGLVITSVGRGKLNAAYLNPRGTVVDLGDYGTPSR